MAGTLFVVATPIGNLEDISLRALRVLRDVAVIAAEDTRRTHRLLAHYQIATPTISVHEHNLRARLPGLLTRLERGDQVALVSDAGMPGISDPGQEVVAACVERGIAVDVLPGPNAALTAVVASGFPTDEVTFVGFPPHKGADRRRWIDRLAAIESTVVAYESPRRLRNLLSELTVSSVDRPIVVGRELTKLHQEILRGTPAQVLSALGQSEPRGEVTVVLCRVTKITPPPEAHQPAVLDLEYGHLTNNEGFSRRAAISELSRRYRLAPRTIYALLEDAKNRSIDLP